MAGYCCCLALIFVVVASFATITYYSFDRSIDIETPTSTDRNETEHDLWLYATTINEDYDDGNVNAPFVEPSNAFRSGDYCSGTRGIYVDQIYNPNYRFELSVLRFMLLEILTRNDNMRVAYDYEHAPNSTIVTLGYEHSIMRYRERVVITMKSKLLKDILYTENIFLQIYHFLFTFFRMCVKDPTMVPEYDRMINFQRYRTIFSGSLRAIDRSNNDKSICRYDELRDMYDGRVCISVDSEYIDGVNFASITRTYWLTMLTRVSWFVERMLVTLTGLRSARDNCYAIKLRPEINIRRVLLFPHRASKTADPSERIAFDYEHNRERIISDIVLYKHRVFHALGFGHRYAARSIMNSYDNDWQKRNLFGILPDDYTMLQRCYNFTRPDASIVGRYVRDRDSLDESLLKDFVSNFERFARNYAR